MEDWEVIQIAERVYHRMRNSMVMGTTAVGSDDEGVQNHQTEGYQDEVRDAVRRLGEFGHSAMLLPGAKVLINYHGGQRALGVIMGTEDPRYRPKGLKPGENHLYMVDGADKKGEGGTTRSVVKALLGWLVTLYGKTIHVGTTDTNTITITGSSSVTITITGDTVNINGTHGDVVVNGISLVHHTHGGVTPGSGSTGQPQ